MSTRDEIDKLLEFSSAFDYGHDNDREIAIVGCAYIESLVKAILTESLIQDEKELESLLDEGRGALPGLVQRARILYLMGKMPKVIFSDVKLIARVRNHFAHNVSASFSDYEVVKNINRLQWYIEAMLGRIAPEGATPREIYQVAIN